MATFDLIGSSARFRTVLERVEMVAPVDSAVMIQGETGTGKEVVARAIHDNGPRSHRAFVALNCAAIPAGLLESELFGHEKGAFTGAVSQTTGKFHAAHGGTLFLDEIGDLPLELQPKLLRVLQEQQFERVGSARSTRVDVRIIAATNLDLFEMIRERKFRADLYYRLNVFPIVRPPLRNRKEDLPLLVDFFVKRSNRHLGKRVENIPHQLLERMVEYHWPGNIRELQNFVERAVITSTGDSLSPRPSEVALLTVKAQHPASTTLSDAERAHIERVLIASDWVISGRDGAAARLGLPRTTLISRMQRLKIKRPAKNGPDSAAFNPLAGTEMERSFAMG
jgi:formate hydrogenlyase transcriptional activator